MPSLSVIDYAVAEQSNYKFLHCYLSKVDSEYDLTEIDLSDSERERLAACCNAAGIARRLIEQGVRVVYTHPFGSKAATSQSKIQTA